MIDTLKENKVSQSITYPVRAGLAANDISAMKTLMERSSSFGNVTMTIWSSQGDQVDTKKLSELITTIGVDKVYVDVPEDVWNNLDLTSGSSTFNLATMTAMMVYLSLLFVKMLWSNLREDQSRFLENTTLQDASIFVRYERRQTRMNALDLATSLTADQFLRSFIEESSFPFPFF